MERATRMLNLLSALVMVLAGIYIHMTFLPLLSSTVMVLLWSGILFYAGLQVEFGYGVIRKHIEELMR